VSAGIGVIGAGVMGAAHVRTIADHVSGADVVAVADADVGRAQSAAANAGAARVVEDPAELIRGGDVDAVVVASSDPTHEQFVLACLAAGKPVLCEKPLATSGEASLRVAETEVGLGRRLVQVGFMRRFDPGYAAVKRDFEQGKVGAPLLVHCVHRNPTVPPTYTSEMLITSSAAHEIDAARWLIGEEVATATVYTPRATTRAADGMRDPQFAVLEMEGGTLVDVEIFVNAGYGYDIRCELVGEVGTLALPSEVAPGFLERFASAYREELQQWVNALDEGEPAGPTAWDGYAASAVADACLESLADGRPAGVRLAPRPDLYD
jgi:myo-inositol 2-dehydrogenase / D-chiro-inositol 1-dehydrogenase